MARPNPKTPRSVFLQLRAQIVAQAKTRCVTDILIGDSRTVGMKATTQTKNYANAWAQRQAVVKPVKGAPQYVGWPARINSGPVDYLQRSGSWGRETMRSPGFEGYVSSAAGARTFKTAYALAFDFFLLLQKGESVRRFVGTSEKEPYVATETGWAEVTVTGSTVVSQQFAVETTSKVPVISGWGGVHMPVGFRALSFANSGSQLDMFFGGIAIPGETLKSRELWVELVEAAKGDMASLGHITNDIRATPAVFKERNGSVIELLRSRMGSSFPVNLTFMPWSTAASSNPGPYPGGWGDHIDAAFELAAEFPMVMANPLALTIEQTSVGFWMRDTNHETDAGIARNAEHAIAALTTGDVAPPVDPGEPEEPEEPNPPADTTPPTVVPISPKQGDTLAATGSTSWTFSATDASGIISGKYEALNAAGNVIGVIGNATRVGTSTSYTVPSLPNTSVPAEIEFYRLTVSDGATPPNILVIERAVKKAAAAVVQPELAITSPTANGKIPVGRFPITGTCYHPSGMAIIDVRVNPGAKSLGAADIVTSGRTWSLSTSGAAIATALGKDANGNQIPLAGIYVNGASKANTTKASALTPASFDADVAPVDTPPNVVPTAPAPNASVSGVISVIVLATDASYDIDLIEWATNYSDEVIADGLRMFGTDEYRDVVDISQYPNATALRVRAKNTNGVYSAWSSIPIEVLVDEPGPDPDPDPPLPPLPPTPPARPPGGTMSVVRIAGTVADVSLEPLGDLRPIISFRLSGPGVESNLVLATEPIEVEAFWGEFEVFLYPTVGIVPLRWYEISVKWLRPGEAAALDVLPYRLHVPEAGGNLSALLQAPPPPGSMVTGFGPPTEPVPAGVVYLDITGPRVVIY